MTDNKTRAEFEELIKSSPFEHMCDRNGDNSAWPGHYKRYETQLAWDVWQAAKERYEQKPVIARSLPEWHEDDGPVLWWEWCGNDWAGEPAWAGTPLDDDWPGYHTHWTPHPKQPTTKE